MIPKWNISINYLIPETHFSAKGRPTALARIKVSLSKIHWELGKLALSIKKNYFSAYTLSQLLLEC